MIDTKIVVLSGGRYNSVLGNVRVYKIVDTKNDEQAIHSIVSKKTKIKPSENPEIIYASYKLGVKEGEEALVITLKSS